MSDNKNKSVAAQGFRLLNEIRGGAPFHSIARNFSQSATAAVGGDLGWNGGAVPVQEIASSDRATQENGRSSVDHYERERPSCHGTFRNRRVGVG